MQASAGEPAEVWLRNGRPARFFWRGRLYTVLLVVERPAQQAQAIDQEASQGRPADRERWLVEATAQPAVAASVFELWHDPKTDHWTLQRS
jgi:Family of unknown function (DUF6504)